MCCNYNKKNTVELRKKMKAAGGTMRFWKAYDRYGGWYALPVVLRPICYDTGFDILPGEIVSNRKEIGHDIWDCGDGIYRGIHVNLNTRKGIEEVNDWKRVAPKVVVVCVTAHVDDLVCVGYRGDAVFMKVKLSRKSWKKALK